jgi:hypothetical protein
VEVRGRALGPRRMKHKSKKRDGTQIQKVIFQERQIVVGYATMRFEDTDCEMR